QCLDLASPLRTPQSALERHLGLGQGRCGHGMSPFDRISLAISGRAIAYDVSERPEQAPRPSRRPLRGLLRMRLIDTGACTVTATDSDLILRARRRRASRRMRCERDM